MDLENEHLMLREAVGNQGGEPICCFALRMRVWCGCQPEQIGKRHVHEYLEQSMAETTRRDHYYAICLLWEMMGRPTPPSNSAVVCAPKLPSNRPGDLEKERLVPHRGSIPAENDL
ncbi:MAG: hypothetical protein PHD37_01355 [Gallionellaceae bacterium]|nr:hypothetical protein [Gallionellaceae bacterium]